MSELKTVNHRIAHVRHILKKSPADFAKSLCISRSYIYEIEKERRNVNNRIIKLVSLNFGINEWWLKTGKGKMLKNSEDEMRQKIEILFDKLCPDFQEYVLQHLDLLLELQKKQQ